MIDRLRAILILVGLVGLIAGAVTFAACQESDNRVVITPAEAAFVPVIESSDVFVGVPRLVLTLLERDRQPEFGEDATFRIRYFDPTEGGIKFHSEAELSTIFVEGLRYLVATEPPFQVGGNWAIAVTVELGDGNAESSPRLSFVVNDSPRGLVAGSTAPDVPTPTIADGVLERMSDTPDLYHGMYEQSASQSVRSGEPFLIVWASADRCAGRLACARAVDQARTIYDQDMIAVLHVEPFGRPRSAALQALIDAANEAWGIEAEPQFFVIDEAGSVAARFEIVVEMSDLAAAIEEALR